MFAFAVLAVLIGYSSAAPIPLNLTQFVGKRVLFVVAHPDDIEGLAGGLVSHLSRQSTEIAYLIATNGDKGGNCSYEDPNTPCTKEALAYIRQKEQINAAMYFKIPSSRVRFLDLEDGMLSSYPEQTTRLAMIAYIRTFKPHAVFTWFTNPNLRCPPMKTSLPYGWGDLGYHPDHMASGKLCMDAVLGFGASSSLIFDELATAGIEPWEVSQFYMFSLTSPEMTHYIDLSGAAFDDKVNALLLHKSQYGLFDPQVIKAGVRWIGEQVGKEAGIGLAEGFTAFF